MKTIATATAPPVGLCTLTELRARAAAALAPATDGDPPILEAPVDAVTPPALMLGWEDPWFEFRTPCYWDARLSVIAFAGRLMPGEGVAALEGLLSYAVARLAADPYPWPHEATRAPAMLEVAGVPLLTARLIYRCPVTIGGT